MSIRRQLTALPLMAASVALIVMAPAGSSTVPCPSEDPATAVSRSMTSGATTAEGSTAASGTGVAAVDEDTVVMIDQSGGSRSYEHVGTEPGILRHASSGPGQGTVYVNDVAGRDLVTAVTVDGLAEYPVAGEASHPRWTGRGEVVWVQDFSTVQVWSPASGSLRTIDRPEGTISVFSPLPRAADELLAVVEEPVQGAPPDGDSLDNLWRHDAVTGRWTRLTSFRATADHWSVIRTPILDRDGSVLFVRIRGVGSATSAPSFELWRLTDAGASRVRSLQGEQFLAGVIDAGLLWNVDRDGVWTTMLEQDGQLRQVGCSGAMVDPRSEMDSDLLEADDTEPAPATVEAILGNAHMGIAVGDFSSRSAANAVAVELGLGGLLVVDHAQAPFAVGPGAYAVVRPFADGEDMEAALDDFRAQFPKYSEQSWIVSLLGSEG